MLAPEKGPGRVVEELGHVPSHLASAITDLKRPGGQRLQPLIWIPAPLSQTHWSSFVAPGWIVVLYDPHRFFTAPSPIPPGHQNPRVHKRQSPMATKWPGGHGACNWPTNAPNCEGSLHFPFVASSEGHQQSLKLLTMVWLRRK